MEINKRMIEFVKKLSKEKKIKYIYSSYHVEGEGEHKIMEFMRYTRNYKIFS